MNNQKDASKDKTEEATEENSTTTAKNTPKKTNNKNTDHQEEIKIPILRIRGGEERKANKRQEIRKQQ